MLWPAHFSDIGSKLWHLELLVMEYLEVFHMDLGQATYETVGWRHDDVIKWKHFRVTGPLCGEFTGDRWIPLTTASDAELWHFVDLCLNKRLSKQSRRWWFEKQSRLLWCTLMKLWRLWNGVLQRLTSIFMIYMLKYIYIYIYLTHCGLVTQCGDTDLGQH